MSHASQEELNQKIEQAKERVEIGATYNHYKSLDQFYIVEDIALIEETEEVCVVYKALYGDELTWVRTVENFLEKTEHGPRFTKVE